MANPRKFSEKIALHNQKQAEETAEFEKIMREVSDATNKTSCGLDENSPSPTTQTYRERPRSAVGPMRSRPAEKRIDTSPYSGPYLSPPPDTTWRRTHSDSSLHTSSHDRLLECHSPVDNFETARRLSSASPEGRPRSAVDLGRVPGISIFPSQLEPGTIQIPIGNNTGSLPDLSSFHFPSPLNTPLDNEDHNSPYAHNHMHGASPRSLSPSPHMRSRYNYFNSPQNEAPGPPMHVNHTGRPHDAYQRQALVYLPPISSIQHSFSQCSPIQTDSNSHQPITRTSSQQMPQSLGVYKYGSSSPCSSPQSPPSPTNCNMNSSTDPSYFIGQANALQHHFEQFSMMDSPAAINVDYVGSTNTTSGLQSDDSSKGRSHELTPDPGYFSTSPSQHNPYVRGAPETTTPNTPSSIPDIIFTDFSSSDELGKDFGVNMVDTLEDALFPSDECLREGLDPIDLDGLQMLTDPDMIADPATEDHLRLDRL